MRIAGAGPNLRWLEFAGATPVQTTLAESYQSLSAGVYDGILLPTDLHHGHHLHEHAPYWTLIGFGSKIIHGLTINKAKFDSLPPAVQDILVEIGEEFEARSARIVSERSVVALEEMERDGATVRSIDDDVRRAWAQALASFPNDMAQDANGRGFPGTEALQAAIEEAEKAGHEWPVRYEIQ